MKVERIATFNIDEENESITLHLKSGDVSRTCGDLTDDEGQLLSDIFLSMASRRLFDDLFDA
jgi:hypothetical protein